MSRDTAARRAEERPSYQTHTYWRQYQSFFRADLRCERPADEPDEEWWMWREIAVHLDRLPAPDARLKLVVLHGGGGYGRLFLPCAMIGRRLGLEVVAADLPGYGLTRPHDPAVDYQTWVDCASDLVEAERARDGRPIILLGGSMGGMLAYAVAAHVGAAGVIATCLLDPRLPEVRKGVARWPWLGATAVLLLRRLAFAIDRVRVPIRWLANMGAMSNNPALAKLVARDPCGGGNSVSLRFLRTFLDSVPPVEPESFSVCPVLLAHPAADAWTPVELSRAFFDRLSCSKTLVLLENAGHFPIEEPGLTQLEEAVRAFIERISAKK